MKKKILIFIAIFFFVITIPKFVVATCNNRQNSNTSQLAACQQAHDAFWNGTECRCRNSLKVWGGASCCDCGETDASTSKPFCGAGCPVSSACPSSSNTNTNVNSGGVIANPTTYSSLADLLNAVITWIRNIGLALAPLLIVYGGFTYITAMGESAKITKAKQILLYAVIGLIVVLLAQSLLGIIKGWV